MTLLKLNSKYWMLHIDNLTFSQVSKSGQKRIISGHFLVKTRAFLAFFVHF